MTLTARVGDDGAATAATRARPLNLEEQRKMYMRKDKTIWKVSDNPADVEVFGRPRDFGAPKQQRLPDDQGIFRDPAKPKPAEPEGIFRDPAKKK